MKAGNHTLFHGKSPYSKYRGVPPLHQASVMQSDIRMGHASVFIKIVFPDATHVILQARHTASFFQIFIVLYLVHNGKRLTDIECDKERANYKCCIRHIHLKQSH